MKSTLQLLLSMFLFVGCSSTPQLNTPKATDEKAVETPMIQPSISDTILQCDRNGFSPSVRIKMPSADFKGTILVLQGWNFPNSSWSDSSDLEKMASELGFALVMPEMGKSIYHKRNYPDTRADWRKYPTRTWLVDSLIANLQQEHQLFLEEHSNYVMGLSTGGRGAFIIAQENPKLFNAEPLYLEDYDQSAFPKDNLYRGFFGANPENWSDDENPC